jgi:hypothetical protein
VRIAVTRISTRIFGVAERGYPDAGPDGGVSRHPDLELFDHDVEVVFADELVAGRDA